MNLGIDLGNTVVGSRLRNDRYYVDGDCFSSLKKLNKIYDNIYIVSRVNEEQRKRSQEWLKIVDFFKQTTIPEENLYYCWDRRDKAVFVKGLKINCFVDDRAEALSCMGNNVYKLLINCESSEFEKFKDKLVNFEHVTNWKEIYLKLKSYG